MGEKFFKFLLLLAGTNCIIAVNSEQHVCTHFVCPERNGYFGHPKLAHKFIKCLDFHPYEKQCPSNLYFNRLSGTCDFGEHVNFEESDTCDLGPKISPRSRGMPSVKCDCGKCCRKPDPHSCFSFFECDENGTAHRKTCPSGLIFNAIEQECDLPHNYDCPIKIPHCDCECRYPVEDQCEAYYKCGNGTASKYFCNDGLQFNEATGTCDFPHNVECGKVSLPDDCKDNWDKCAIYASRGECLCDASEPDCSWAKEVRRHCPESCNIECKKPCEGENCNDQINVSTTAQSQIPVFDTSTFPTETTTVNLTSCNFDCHLGKIITHPTDCTKYIVCITKSIYYEMPCPPKTRWDATLKVCNHEDAIPCLTKPCTDNILEQTSTQTMTTRQPNTTQETIKTTIKPITTEITSEATTTRVEPSTTVQKTTTKQPTTEISVEETTTEPFEDTTTEEVVQTTTVQKTTKQPTTEITVEETTTEPFEDTTTEEVVQTTTTVQKTTKPPTTESSVEETTTEPFEDTTTKEVVQTTTVLKTTTKLPTTKIPVEEATTEQLDDTTIDEVLQTITVEKTTKQPTTERTVKETTTEQLGDTTTKEVVNETTTAIKEPSTAVSKTTTKPTSERPTTVNQNKPDNSTNCIRCKTPNDIAPHPNDCTKFIHCSNGNLYIKDCAAGLHFNPHLRVCDWPHHAKCESGPDKCEIEVPTCDCVQEPDPIQCDCDCCLRPHPDDCTSYYFCQDGSKEFHTCSDGLVFHPQNETCVLPKYYPECNVEKAPHCECDCLYPSSVCTEYFKCVDGLPVKHECSGGLFFNDDKHTCDYPENVDCRMPQKRAFKGFRSMIIQPEDCGKLPNGKYRAGNSTEYYLCSDKVAFLIPCMDGRYYDTVTQTCRKTG